MKLWHHGGGEDNTPRLVLIHGLGANADVWLPLVPHVDRRWIAPDLRGHGRSPHQAPYGYGGHAADSKDARVNAADMAPFDAHAHVFEGARHNAQVEQPRELWQFNREELS